MQGSANSRRRLALRAGARGAIFVEALIVIASFTMMFMGLVFFRMLYVHSAITSRLARGGAIAYSMSGCKDPSPKDWIAKDAKKYTILPPDPPSNDTAPTKESMSSQSSSTSQATSNIPGLGGNGFLNPIVTVADAADVSSNTKGKFGTKKTLFKSHLEPRSYVTCGDIVRPGDFNEVFGYVKDVFGGKM